MQKSCQIKLVWVVIVSIVSIVSNENRIRLLALLLSNVVSRVCIACNVVIVSSVCISWYSM